TQIAALTTWIKQGAKWPQTAAVIRPADKDSGFKVTPHDREFWSFQPVADPTVPRGKNSAWAQKRLDAFILAKLDEKGLMPAPPADPRTLLRRMYFDVIGLPPTPEEVEGFVAAWDGASANRQALVERVVDRF